MKWWHYLVLGGIVSVCIGYVWMHREELGLTHQHAIGADDSRDLPSTGPVAHPATISWQKVDRSADGFRVEMPTDVKQIQIPAYNGTGGADQVNMIFSNPSSDTTFSVVWQDNPPVGSGGRKPDHILEDARDGAVARTQTALVNDAATSTQGFPGRTFEARNSGGGIMNSRLVYAGSRLYMLTAAFPSASARRPKGREPFLQFLHDHSLGRIQESWITQNDQAPIRESISDAWMGNRSPARPVSRLCEMRKLNFPASESERLPDRS